MGIETGNLYGTVVDNQGAPLPGVTVTLAGPGAPKVETSNALGRFRFIELAPGNYKPGARFDGFSMIDYPSIFIHAGRNTQIEMTMSRIIAETMTSDDNFRQPGC